MGRKAEMGMSWPQMPLAHLGGGIGWCPRSGLPCQVAPFSAPRGFMLLDLQPETAGSPPRFLPVPPELPTSDLTAGSCLAVPPTLSAVDQATLLPVHPSPTTLAVLQDPIGALPAPPHLQRGTHHCPPSPGLSPSLCSTPWLGSGVHDLEGLADRAFPAKAQPVLWGVDSWGGV